MPIVTSPDELLIDDVFVDLRGLLGHNLYLKCENFNFAGSIKLKAARSMIDEAERSGRLRPDSVIIESSSGNLGVAIAAIAASRRYRFVCVTDPRANRAASRLITSLGGEVVEVTQLDETGGYLGSRIELVRRLCHRDARFVWLNQYRNPENWRAHYQHTAPEIVKHFPDVDLVFIGAGTTGTLMGCARFLREQGHPAKIVAVDSIGSVTFGGRPGPRFLPGLGTSRRPEIVDESLLDDVVMHDERSAVQMCHRLARRGFLFGGSTGSVLSAAERYLAGRPANLTAVAISPDLGDRYLDTLYDPGWVDRRFPAALAGPEPADIAASVLLDRLPGQPAGVLPAAGARLVTAATVDFDDPPEPPRDRGATLWLTGLPSAGKTAIAKALAERLRADGHQVEILDSSEFRATISSDLGFSRADRDANVYRVGRVAQLLARNGVKVLVAVIAPYAAARAAIREQHASTRTEYREIHVATSLDACIERDTKGRYADQRGGRLAGLTGIDDPYEEPVRPDLRLTTEGESVGTSTERVRAAMVGWGLA